MKKSFPKNIIITGGSGYIGAHLVYILFKLKKYNIIVLDKNSHPFIKKHKIQFFMIEFKIIGIIRFPEILSKPILYFPPKTPATLKNLIMQKLKLCFFENNLIFFST